MTWIPVKKNKGRGQRPDRKASATPRVCNYKGSGASLLVPVAISGGAETADIYHDGNGKIAVSFCTNGAYSVCKRNQKGTVVGVRIPAEFRKHIPIGTTEVPEIYDNGMLVIDLTSIAV